MVHGLPASKNFSHVDGISGQRLDIGLVPSASRVMLSFSIEFPVEETSSTEFFKSVSDWLNGSPHTSISKDEVISVVTSEAGSWSNGSETIYSYLVDANNQSSAAIRYTKTENGIDWITTVCFDSNEDDSWVSVRTERNSEYAQAFIPSAKKPYVVRNIISNLRGGVDGELRVQDKPVILKNIDLNMAVRLINGDAGNHLPFVYFSAPFEGDLSINYAALARHLCGIAHVLVEPSRDFSRELQPQVFAQNPYGGFVGIAFQSGEWSRLDPRDFADEFDLRREIFARIQHSLLNRRFMPRCSWTTIQARDARKQRIELEQKLSADEYAATFDQEMSAKDEQISQSEHEISRLRSELQEFRRRTPAQDGGISLRADREQEFEPTEFQQVVLESLANYIQNVEGGTRKAHVLEAILASNDQTNSLQEKREKIKQLLRGYRTMDAPLRSSLSVLGFTIDEDGKHYKLTYRGDPRYQYILAKTGSDSRGGLNAAAGIARLCF